MVEEVNRVQEKNHGSRENSMVFCTPLSDTIFLRKSTDARRGPARKSTKGGWTSDEDEKLIEAVRQNDGRNWKKIAEFIPERTDVQCLHRWQKVLNPDLVKGAWTKEEDDLIISLVGKYGPKKWSLIAKSLPGRIGKQCRERWHNHLNPELKKDAWSIEEETILIDAHQIYGNKWAELAKFLPGRAENSIKNHWNCSLKKRSSSISASSVLPEPSSPASLGIDKNLNRASYVSRVFPSTKRIDGIALEAETTTPFQSLKTSECDSLPECHSQPDKSLNMNCFKNLKSTENVRSGSSNLWKNGTCPGHIDASSGSPDSGTCSEPFTLLSEGQSCTSRTDHILETSVLLSRPEGPSTGELPCDANVKFPPTFPSPTRSRDGEQSATVGARTIEVSSEFFRYEKCETSSLLSTFSCIFSSPDSILRSAARSFKNTPSIIRKRPRESSKQLFSNNKSHRGCSDGI